MIKQEYQSIFIEYFGSSPYIKVLDFLIQGQEFDYSMTEVARGAGVGIYFWLSGGDVGSIIGGGSSIPQPPALPD